MIRTYMFTSNDDDGAGMEKDLNFFLGTVQKAGSKFIDIKYSAVVIPASQDIHNKHFAITEYSALLVLDDPE